MKIYNFETTTKTKSTQLKGFILNKIMLYVLLAIVIGGLATATAYFFWQYKKVTRNADAAEQTRIIKEVSKLMELPDEVPTIATVTEKEKLSEQNFFKKAENGDKVLLFLEAEKAILYRPTTHKIIDVAPIKQSQNSDESPTTFTTNETPSPSGNRVAIFNGTNATGLTQKLADQITAANPEFEVISRENASSINYSKTIVIDISGKSSAQATELAGIINGTVGTLPQEERKPNADILIIIGQDYATTQL